MINLILCSLEKAAFSRAYSLYAIFSDIHRYSLGRLLMNYCLFCLCAPLPYFSENTGRGFLHRLNKFLFVQSNDKTAKINFLLRIAGIAETDSFHRSLFQVKRDPVLFLFEVSFLPFFAIG